MIEVVHRDIREIEKYRKFAVMATISEYESSRLLEFFKAQPDNEKKLVQIAKTLTKNTLTHLLFNGEILI